MNITKTTDRHFNKFDSEDVVTTWTIGSYALSLYASGTGFTDWRIENNDRDRPELQHDYTSAAPTLGVNWSAQGTKPTDDAAAYAALILEACDVAAEFNAIMAANA